MYRSHCELCSSSIDIYKERVEMDPTNRRRGVREGLELSDCIDTHLQSIINTNLCEASTKTHKTALIQGQGQSRIEHIYDQRVHLKGTIRRKVLSIANHGRL